MIQALAEPQSGIEHHVFSGHARLRQSLQSLAEEFIHRLHHVVVVRVLLHRLRGALHVHRDVACARRGDRAPHLGVRAMGGDVVDQTRAGVQRGAGHGGFHRVDRDRRFDLLNQRPDDGQHPSQLLRFVHRPGVRSRGLTAHVQEVRTLGRELQRMRHRGVGREVLAAI